MKKKIVSAIIILQFIAVTKKNLPELYENIALHPTVYLERGYKT